MSEISLAVGDGARRMTYAELAQARGISLPAARRLTLRHRWPKQPGNDGLVRVTVPLSALERPRKPAAPDDAAPDTTSLASGTVSEPASDTARAIRALEGAVEGLREQLTVANERADHAERRVDDLRRRLDAEAEERRRLTAILADQRAAPAPGRRWWRFVR